jgi:hypothetical protein
MKKVLLLVLTLFITACASTIQSASVSEAYKKYQLQEFERTLEVITQAENTKETNSEMQE